MAHIPAELHYTKDHEWIWQAEEVWVVGLTNFAQRQLGDVVYVELPQVGATFEVSEPFGSIESVKAVSEIYMPLAGSVVEVNTALQDEPEMVNTEPYGDGWLIKVRATGTPSGLLNASQYEAYLRSEAE